jgi:hypothetical protein
LGSVPPADQYAYLNQAYAFSQSLADSPPDYTYDYQGEAPWVWQSPDGYYRVAERLPMGVRYFYYAPGASTPYLVQDPQYSYGYSDGRLAAVYGADGRVLPYDVEARQARSAGLYLAWAAGLYAAARHEEHVAVSQARWDGERQAVYADQARWNAAQQRNAAWATYSQAHQNDQAHWADQRYVRAAEAARFAQAVNDGAALAHAQQAAAEARTIAQSHGERPPGSAPQGGFDRHAPSAPAFAPPGQAAGDFPRGQTHGERPPTPGPQTGFDRRAPEGAPVRGPGPAASDLAAAQHQIETRHADQGLAQARAQQQEAAQAQDHQAQAHDQQAAARQAEAAAAGRAASDRAAADAHRQAAEQTQVKVERNAQASAEPRSPQPPAHAEPAPTPPHPQAPPAKGKPKPDEPPR